MWLQFITEVLIRFLKLSCQDGLPGYCTLISSFFSQGIPEYHLSVTLYSLQILSVCENRSLANYNVLVEANVHLKILITMRFLQPTLNHN